MLALFSKVTLTVILSCFLIASIITSFLQTKQNFNTSPSNDWVLVGSLYPTEATLKVRRRPSYSVAPSERLVISTTPFQTSTEDIVFEQSLMATTNELTVDQITVSDLESNKKYYYGIIRNNVIGQQGSFKTLPQVNERSSFKFATAGCSWTGSNAEVFTHIMEEDPLFFVHLGDFHYEDIGDNDVAIRLEAIDKVLGSKTQSKLFSNTALVYMWDDHDWLGDNTDGEGPGKPAALESYRMAFPHYPLPSNSSMYHAFTVGTVRFIVSDLRSESITGVRIYSEEQKEWLYNEIADAASSDNNYDFIVWVSTKPWIGDVENGGDSWLGQPSDRQELSDYISTVLSEKQNFIAIASDAHMVAFDDGTHTYYGSSEDDSSTSSFPILQSGPLSQFGTSKGGPFSHGCKANYAEVNHQYSTVEFVYREDSDANAVPCLQIKSYQVPKSGKKKKEIFSQILCGKIFNSKFATTETMTTTTTTTTTGNSTGLTTTSIQQVAKPSQVEGSCDVSLSTHMIALLATTAALLIIIFIESAFAIPEGQYDSRWHNGVLICLTVLLMYFLTILVGAAIPISKGITQVDTFAVALIGTIQLFTVAIYLLAWIINDGRAIYFL